MSDGDVENWNVSLSVHCEIPKWGNHWKTGSNNILLKLRYSYHFLELGHCFSPKLCPNYTECHALLSAYSLPKFDRFYYFWLSQHYFILTLHPLLLYSLLRLRYFSQHQGLFQWLGSFPMYVAKVLEHQLHQVLPMNWVRLIHLEDERLDFDLAGVLWSTSRVFSNSITVQASVH